MDIRPYGSREDTAMNNVPDGYKQTEVGVYGGDAPDAGKTGAGAVDTGASNGRADNGKTNGFYTDDAGVTGIDAKNAGMTGVGAYGAIQGRIAIRPMAIRPMKIPP